MPSMQLTFSATTSLPSGLTPRANTSTPQSRQSWWRMACLLKRYSRRFSSPARSWKLFGDEEREMQALLGADRAVAGGHHGHVGGAFEAHLAAMAAAACRSCCQASRSPLPNSRHQTIAHPRGIVSIARQPRDQRALLDACAYQRTARRTTARSARPHHEPSSSGTPTKNSMMPLYMGWRTQA